MNTEEKIKYWFELADDDIDSAGIMLEKNKFLQTGFYCHQAAEKTIKGYCWFINCVEPPYTHNLLKLSEISGLDELLENNFKNHIDLLMPLNIEARYPDERREILKTLTRDKTIQLYKKTRELVVWIQQLTLK